MPLPKLVSVVSACFPRISWQMLNPPNRRGTDPYALLCGRGGMRNVPLFRLTRVMDQVPHPSGY